MNRNPTVAIVIGHSFTSPGASNSFYGITEYEFNRELAINIHSLISRDYKSRFVPKIILRESYRGLPNKINKYSPGCIISLHSNAFNKTSSGTETLYYHKSIQGKRLADLVNANIVSVLGLNNRGIKSRSVEDRGGYLLKYTNAPCVISEPFFIDNSNDYEVVKDNLTPMAEAYASAIYSFFLEVGTYDSFKY